MFSTCLNLSLAMLSVARQRHWSSVHVSSQLLRKIFISMYVFMSLTMQHIACCLIWTWQAADLELRKNEIWNLKSGSVPYSSQNDSSKCVLGNLDIHLLINLNENSLKMVTWKIWCVLESLLNYLENEKVQAFQTLFCVISFKNGVIVFFKRKLIPWEKENNLLWEFETKLVSVQMRDILTAATVYGLNTDQSKIWLPDEKNTVKCESSSYYGLYTSLFTR